jgi:superfamily II DNA or RNA helicase
MPYALRPYQVAALDAVADHIARGARRVVVAMSTGAGKTILFSHLGKRLGLRPTDRILILAHRDELVQQARAKYLGENPGEMVGIEKAESRATPMDRVCVASVQTLQGARLADFASRWGVPALIVTDECHHAPSASYQEIYIAFGVTAQSGPLHVGVTATPKRSDNVGLDATYDAIAYSIGIAELTKLGALVPLAGYRVETKTSLDAVKTVAGDFNAGQLSNAVDTAERNARVIAAYKDITPGRKAVVFAASVAHSQHLAEMFSLAGFNAAHLDGTTDQDERGAIIAGFTDGAYDVVTNCGVLCEGWDEPSLEVVIIARPTKSPVLYCQMIGRATRLFPGKKKAAVIDIVDATRRHSIMNLPTLLGLPPTFNLGGRSVVAVAAKHAALMNDNPLVAALVNDAGMLARLSGVSESEQMGVLVRHLMERAREKHTYVPVDMFLPPPMPSTLDAFTYMVWTPVGDDVYRLNLRNEAVTIRGDLLGKYTVTLSRKGARDETLGVHNEIRFAFAQAELWVRDFRGDLRIFVDKNAKWRSEPATAKQRAALRRFNVEASATMTKHEAIEALDAIMLGLARGTIRAPRRKAS